MLPCGIPLITFIHDENLLLILTLIFLLNRKERIQSIISEPYLSPTTQVVYYLCA